MFGEARRLAASGLERLLEAAMAAAMRGLMRGEPAPAPRPPAAWESTDDEMLLTDDTPLVDEAVAPPPRSEFVDAPPPIADS